MSIANDKIVNLQDAKVLYDDLRGRIKDNSVAKVLDTPADIQSFSDAARFPMELKVGIEPVQDLHGYDHPWVGGAGKNKLKYPYATDTRTAYGITETFNSDGTIVLDGTCTGELQTRLQDDRSGYDFYIAPGTYILSGMDANQSAYIYVSLTKNGSYVAQDIATTKNGAYTFTIDSNVDYDNVRVAFYIATGQVFSNKKIEPMIRLSTESDSTFAPYTNIAPISGWTGAKVTVTGKNLFDGEYVDGWINDTGATGTDGNSKHSNLIPVKIGQDYTYTFKSGIASSVTRRVHGYDESGNWVTMLYKTTDVISVGSTKSGTFTVPNGVAYIKAVFYKDDTQIVVEYGQSFTGYVDYTDTKTYPISFPSSAGTVYGGELTIHSDGSGELVVDHGVFDMGNATWTLAANNQLFRTNSPADSAEIIRGGIDGVCSCYSNAKGMTYENFIASNGTYKINDNQYSLSRKYIIVRDTSVSDAASFKTKMAGQTLTYELASPVTYQLIPGQVFALLGQNNVWADCGQVNYLEYVRETIGEVIPNRFDGIDQDIVETNTYEKTISEANAIQTFEDGAEWPMGMQIAVDPVQDLHGYDHPWPGGGSKNLLPPNRTFPYTTNGITFQLKDDGTITATGTASGDAAVYSDFDSTSIGTNGDLYFTGAQSGGASTYHSFIWDKTNNQRAKQWNGTTNCENAFGGVFKQVKIVEGVAYSFAIRVQSGVTVSNAVFYPMICLGTETDPTFVPHSNICPISGFTGANVTVNGINLFDEESCVKDKYINASGTIVNASTDPSVSTYGGEYSDLIPVQVGKSYVLSFDNSSTVVWNARVHGYNSSGTWVKQIKVVEANEIRSYSESFVIPDGVSSVRLSLNYVRLSNKKFGIGSTYHIAFPTSAGTVYGGTLTVNKDGTGTLVVKEEKVSLGGDQNWTLISSRNGFRLASVLPSHESGYPTKCEWLKTKTTVSTETGVVLGAENSHLYVDGVINVIPGVTNVESWKTYLNSNPLVLTKPIAPATYSLTAPQVLSLIGKNHVWADCGDILSLTYNSKQGIGFIREDTSGQIASVVNPVKEELSDAEAAMAIVVDGDTAPKNITSGQYVFVKNHSTLATGMYHATTAIASGASVTSSNVEADADGGFNAINDKMDSLLSKTTVYLSSSDSIVDISSIVSPSNDVLSVRCGDGNVCCIPYFASDGKWKLFLRGSASWQTLSDAQRTFVIMYK